MDLSVQQMRMVREVARLGTISAAAHQLGYTASAVSQQLSAIERLTGIAVLERVGRNVLLTDAGRELVAHADLVLIEMEKAQAAIERVHGGATGLLRVGFIESVSSAMLVPVVDRLRETHPGLVIRARETDTIDSNLVVKMGELDLSFMIDYPIFPREKQAGLDRVPVCRDVFRVVVPARPDGPALSSRVPLESLAGVPFVGPPADNPSRQVILLMCRQAGFEAEIVHEFTDYPTTIRLVGANMGVALVPELALVNVPDSVEVLELEVPHFRTVEMVYRSASAERPIIKAFVAAVGEQVDLMGLDRGKHEG